MLAAVKSEYQRRGEPLSKVGWDIQTMCRYQRAQLAKAVQGDDIGAYDYELPDRSSKQRKPPSLPDWVLQWEAEEAQVDGGDEGDSGDNSEEQEELPSMGWRIITETIKGRKVQSLAHKAAGLRVELTSDGGGQWELCKNRKGEQSLDLQKILSRAFVKS